MPGRSVAYVFTGNFSNLTAGLTAASRNVTELGTKMTALDKNGRQMRAGLTTLGSAAGKVGLVAAAGVGAFIVAAANFDKSISAVQAATHETAGNMELLRAAAIKAGADTKYSASEAAEGIEALAKAGVSTKDILAGGLTGALNLAAAGGQSVADAAEAAATTLTQFKLSGDQTSHVADVLAAAAGKAQGEVSDMAAALKYVGPVAAQMGISLEQTSGTIAELASQGIIGEQAGTSLRGMLTSLTSPSKQAADQMDALGISLYDAQGKFVGLDGIAGELQASMGGLTAAERDQALGRIFGNEQITAARILYAGGAADVQKWTKAVDDQGYAADTAAIKMNNLSGDLEQLRGSLETALIGAGDGSQGPLRSLVQGATDAVNAFNKIPPSAQGTVTALLGITAVTGGALWFGSKVVNGVASTREALEQLGISSTKTSKALRAAGTAAGTLTVLFAVGTAVDALYKSTDRAVPGVEALTKSLIGLGDAQAAQNLQKQIGDIGKALDTINDPGFFADFQGKVDGLFGDQIGAAATTGILGDKLQSSKQELREAAAAVDALDQALANIVTSGSPEQAATAFSNMAEAQGLSAEEQKQLLKLLPQYKEAVDGASNATVLATDATENYGTAQRRARQQTAAFNDEIRKQKEDARGVARSFVGLGDSIDDTKVSLGEWLKSLEKQARALRDFTSNARTAAKRGLDDGLIKSLEEAGPAGALRMKQLADSTDAEIKRANRAWAAGQRAIRDYVDLTVPKKTVDVDTSRANRNLNILYARLAEASGKHVTTYIDVITRSFNDKRDGLARATGGPIYGPGTKTSDSVPVMASRGEFMMSAAAVDHYGLDTMFKMNARRLADGGDVAGRPDNGLQIPRPTTVGQATAAIVALRQTIRSLNLDIHESEKAIKQETRERDHATKVVQRNQAEVDRITGLYDSLSSAIQANLAANQFETGSAWSSGGGIAGILGRLNASTANANAMTAATGTLSASLTGAALQSVLEQGLTTTKMFAGLSAADLAKYQADFDINAAAVARAGNTGATARYGAEQEKANQILAASLAEEARQTAELRTATRQNATAERQRDRMEKALTDVRDELKKLRDAAHSGARSRR